MTDIRYILTPDQGDWTDAHFELRASDQEHPYRVVLRREEGTGNVAAGPEGAERQLNLPDARTIPGDLVVEVAGDAIRFRAGGRFLHHRMENTRTGTALAATGHNMQWRIQASEATPEEVRIGGQVLQVPASAPQAEKAALRKALRADDDAYLQFLASHIALRPGEILTVIDIDPSPL